jgi:hypothetical protein
MEPPSAVLLKSQIPALKDAQKRLCCSSTSTRAETKRQAQIAPLVIQKDNGLDWGFTQPQFPVSNM